jgi:hypothetical protein
MLTNIAIFVGMIVGICGASLPIFKHYYEQLKNPADRERYIAEFKNPTFDKIYKTTLNSGLAILDRIFGEKFLSFRSLGLCWLLSFVYSISFFLIAWLFGAGGENGVVELFRSDTEWYIRAFLIIIIGLSTWLYYVLFKIINLIPAKFKKILGSFGNKHTNWVLEYLVITIPITFGIAMLIVAITGERAGNGTLVGLGAVAGAVAGTIARAGVEIVVGAGVFSVIVLFFLDLNHSTITIIFFWGLSPLLNSILDWLSWGVSRCLGKHIQEKNNIPWVLIHGFADFVVAIALLLGLSALLVGGISAYNWIVLWRGFPDVELQLGPILESLHTDPFGKYRWVSWMLLSTLIPTVLHLLMVLFSLITKNATMGGFRRAALVRLENHHQAAKKKGKKAADQDLNLPAIYLTSSWLLAIIFFSSGAYLVWLTAANLTGPAAEVVWKTADLTWRFLGGV